MRIDAGTAGRSRLRLSLTPVIDVVFLLLLFFMLASTFARFADVGLELSGRAAPASETPARTAVVLVLAGGGYEVDGRAVPDGALAEALRAALPEEGGRIVLRPAPEATAQDVVSAIEQASEAGLGAVVLAR